MKRPLIFALITLVIGGGLIFAVKNKKIKQIKSLETKIYVAVEGDGIIAVVDPVGKSVVKKIDLAKEHQGGKLTFAPHNVQVAPDGKTVWVTANVGGHMDHHSHLIPSASAHEAGMNGMMMNEPDEVVVINPDTDQIVKRMQLGVGNHLAHVVVTTDGNFAYVTAQKADLIYKINVKDFILVKKINLPAGSEPHGIRLSPTDDYLYIAFMKGKSLGVFNTKTEKFLQLSVKGQLVQAGVTPDGKTAVASIYDSKSIIIYNTTAKKYEYVNLPQAAKGPIQMYSTPDSQFVYLADQGYYFGQAASDLVYKISLTEKKVVKEIKAGKAPHGVVVSKDSKFVYVTNLLSGDISIIDTANDQEVAKIAVGKEPNGISIWHKTLGGTP